MREASAVPSRVRSWPVVGWTVAMPWILTPPYAATNRLDWPEAVVIPMTGIDRSVPFAPQWAGVYLALFPFMWLAVLRQPDGRHAAGTLAAFAVALAIACTVFLIVPTSYPHRPAADGWMALIAGLDTVRNACPSLHGAYAVLAAWALVAASAGSGAGRRAMIGCGAAAMAAAILWATLSVRQHGVIDLGAGMALGVAVALAGQRWWWPARRAAEMA